MGTTPRHAIRYPAGSDTPNVPSDMLNTTTDVDNVLPYVSTSTPAHVAGLVWCNPTTGRVQISDGGAWISITASAGVVQQFGGSAAPFGWLLCDGQAVSRSTYADLFAAIGTLHGVGDGSTTFNVPDMKGRAPVHHDAGQTEFLTVGQGGGEKTHLLTTAEMPSHSHAFDGDTDTYASGAASSIAFGQTPASNPNYSGGIIQATGGGGAHNNLQPYRVLNFIIRT